MACGRPIARRACRLRQTGEPSRAEPDDREVGAAHGEEPQRAGRRVRAGVVNRENKPSDTADGDAQRVRRQLDDQMRGPGEVHRAVHGVVIAVGFEAVGRQRGHRERADLADRRLRRRLYRDVEQCAGPGGNRAECAAHDMTGHRGAAQFDATGVDDASVVVIAIDAERAVDLHPYRQRDRERGCGGNSAGVGQDRLEVGVDTRPERQDAALAAPGRFRHGQVGQRERDLRRPRVADLAACCVVDDGVGRRRSRRQVCDIEGEGDRVVADSERSTVARVGTVADPDLQSVAGSVDLGRPGVRTVDLDARGPGGQPVGLERVQDDLLGGGVADRDRVGDLVGRRCVSRDGGAADNGYLRIGRRLRWDGGQ